ncbi:DUF4236 domain-containing protein [Bradyrhizobium sp. 143]|uniref:DUF4236 domain-containing protein n=1 Tax=Bradyrhizobium sp. 143 TaxID=2782619 RepID=UPI001FF8CA6F|nr:DUF4236 domain-containing protein [Bradyrhizobium sp. 143]MCK1707846.1 DUF4236 domain-containing protein [Bradyrhizobium sp. 143]
MGFRFRRSFKIVPGVRLNLSGSGASVSLGPRGLHYTIGPHGTRTTVGLPGSGVSCTSYQPYASVGASPPPLPEAPDSPTREPIGTVIDSASIDELVANSTIEIAQTLAVGRSRWRRYKILIAILSALFAVSALMLAGSASAAPPVAAFVLTAGVVLVLGSLAIHCRETSTVSLVYELSAEQSARFEALSGAFHDLASCGRIWNVPLERQEADWKRNAGASKLIQRHQISLGRDKPPLVKSNVDFLKLPLGKETFYLTPDAILVTAGKTVAGFGYEDVEFMFRSARFIEEETPPADATVVDQTLRES